MTLIDLSIHRAETYLREAIDGFIADPPDDDYQRGFLAALVVVYREAVGSTTDARIIARLAAAEKLT